MTTLAEVFAPTRVDTSHVYANNLDKWEQTYHAAFTDAMGGCDQVFDLTHYTPQSFDSEQYVPIMEAVQMALRSPGATAEQVGLYVLRAVARVAHSYAVYTANEATGEVRA